jgi:Tol biopolymer transport system component
MGIDGKGMRMLAAANSYLAAPVWSADGTQIYFTSDKGVEAVMADGTGQRTVADGFATMSPDLSPDGKTLAWSVNGGGIYTQDLTMTSARAQHLVDGESPRYSHDGQRLLFVRDSGGAATIAILEIATGNITNLVDTHDYLTNAVWFPDDQRIAYLSKDGIEVMTLAEKKVKRVADEFAAKSLDLSADGKTLAYAVNGDSAIFVLCL